MSADTQIPVALQRAMRLLVDRPESPDFSRGYLDLLGADSVEDGLPTNNGVVQALWASGVGSMLYDQAQALIRRFVSTVHNPIPWLDLPDGGVAVDVGSGPGNVTAALGASAGPDGLAVGVDISEAMLARAVHAAASSTVGFIRADAQRLPLRDEIAHGVVSIAALQLIPDPAAALAEMVRILRPGGRLAVMVPTTRGSMMARLFRLIPNAGGAYFFTDDEIADTVEKYGMAKVRVRRYGSIQWIQGHKPA